MGSPVQEVKVFGCAGPPVESCGETSVCGPLVREGRRRSKSFRTKTEAERYRSLLLQAQHDGDRFDEPTGQPASWQRAGDDVSVHV